MVGHIFLFKIIITHFYLKIEIFILDLNFILLTYTHPFDFI